MQGRTSERRKATTKSPENRALGAGAPFATASWPGQRVRPRAWKSGSCAVWLWVVAVGRCTYYAKCLVRDKQVVASRFVGNSHALRQQMIARGSRRVPTYRGRCIQNHQLDRRTFDGHGRRCLGTMDHEHQQLRIAPPAIRRRDNSARQLLGEAPDPDT